MRMSKEILNEISKVQCEPAWLLDIRNWAWGNFEKLPFPTVKDEEWKYVPLRDFHLSDFEMAFHSQPEPQKRFATGESGVQVLDLTEAIIQFPDLVCSVLKEIQIPSASKFESLHQALWHGGIFIYVPKGVCVKEPIYHKVFLKDSDTSIFPFTIVVVEAGAECVVIDEMESSDSSQKKLSNAYRYLHLKEDAKLQYVNIQRWGKGVSHFESQFTKVEKGGNFCSVNVGLGSTLTKLKIHTELKGSGAEAYPLGVFFGSGTQHFDFYTIQDHLCRDTRSDLLFKSALKDFSESSYQGVIHIPKEAQKSDAYQANKNLLLDPDAKARSTPKLEIIADDVRCTHSATVGTIEADETFYLESRGLSHPEAVQMVVSGFFEQVFQRIPDKAIRNRLHEIVEQKLRKEKTCQNG